jgi:hypothetical protein
VVDFYYSRKLSRPFNLSGVPGFNWKRYSQVQVFTKLDAADELPLLNFLVRTNIDLVAELINLSESAEDASSC